jgi:hypothetical protein
MPGHEVRCNELKTRSRSLSISLVSELLFRLYSFYSVEFRYFSIELHSEIMLIKYVYHDAQETISMYGGC